MVGDRFVFVATGNVDGDATIDGWWISGSFGEAGSQPYDGKPCQGNDNNDVNF